MYVRTYVRIYLRKCKYLYNVCTYVCVCIGLFCYYHWFFLSLSQFAVLTPLEPRLSKKLHEPLTSLIHSTSAMSLLYECVSTMVSGMPKNLAAMQLCVSKLRLFVEDPDQNCEFDVWFSVCTYVHTLTLKRKLHLYHAIKWLHKSCFVGAVYCWCASWGYFFMSDSQNACMCVTYS